MNGLDTTEGVELLHNQDIDDEVAKDEPLLEISTDKVDAEVPAPASGKLGRILHGPGATVAVETVIGVIVWISPMSPVEHMMLLSTLVTY